jgi:predicted ATPase
VAALVTKSLVEADARSTAPRFHLLETTRAYALAKLVESGDVNMLGRRHAEYFDLESEKAPSRQPASDDHLGPSMRMPAQQNGPIKRHSRTNGTMMASLR